MKIKLAPLGVRGSDGRLIALDADLVLPEVFPVRVFDGYERSIGGRGERARMEDGFLVADFHLKGTAAELIEAGTHTLSPVIHNDDWEVFEEAETAVLVKGELFYAAVTSASNALWGRL